MHTLNLGVLAHVDAGKTSLTERLLHAAGAIDEIGSVDAGSTQTDSLALERRRGITIKTAVASFVAGGVTVNLIDTPGHPDFIAEVERVLAVLDGAVLVVSAVEGVQAQTRVLMRTLQRLRIPTLLFVNKIDRTGAQYGTLLRSLAEKLSPAIVPMGSVAGLGTREAAPALLGAAFVPMLAERLAENDDALMAAYLDGSRVSHRRLRRALAAQTGQALVHPVFFGSAITGAGVDALVAGVTELLPAARDDADGPLSGTVFKVTRGPAGEKIAYVRLFSGTARIRDRLEFADGTASKITGISVFDRGAAQRSTSIAAGQIGMLRGLGDVRIGDAIGVRRPTPADRHHFAPPTLETVVVPGSPTAAAGLHTALTQLAEQDPLINLRHDPVGQEISVSLYGEVQKEVIQATLAEEYGVDVTFRESTTICVERLVGSGAAVEIIAKEPNPFLATVGLRVEPAPPGTGITFALDVELGSMPSAFFKAVEETVHTTLRQGIHGWPVLDCRVAMTHSGYWARQSHSHGTFDKSMSSTAGDFRNLTPLVLMAALRAAGTAVLEPVHRFRLELPPDTLGSIFPVLARLGAVPETPDIRGASGTLDGLIPAAGVHGLQQLLPGLTRGEGVLESAFDGYQPVRGSIPRRKRWDLDPLDRETYLLAVQRRVLPVG